jgi:hypothetical protein
MHKAKVLADGAADKDVLDEYISKNQNKTDYDTYSHVIT